MLSFCSFDFVGRMKGISSFTIVFDFDFVCFDVVFKNPFLKGSKGFDGEGDSTLGASLLIKMGLVGVIDTNDVLSSVRLKLLGGTMFTFSSGNSGFNLDCTFSGYKENKAKIN